MYPGTQVTRSYVNAVPVIFCSLEDIEEVITESVTDNESKTAYWRAKRGGLRKAGKSQARAGETLVYLTDKEFASASTGK